ncbi:fimbrial protein [Serratia sp. (in: enterobacteria)]|uniref:fimbrial protein n=1 Tax=Serratia sp. (in: enterobacteria) TaxID=616 RepID=UPI00398A3793
MDMKATLKMAALGLALGGMAISHSALAYDIKFNGTVKPSPCTVKTEGGTIKVPLGEVEAHILTVAQGSDWKDFNLDLIDCPVGTKKAVVTFSGESEYGDLYKNTAVTDAAGAVQIEMVDATTAANLRLGSGSIRELLVDEQTRKATLPMRARMFSTHGGATPGKVEGAVQVGIEYP